MDALTKELLDWLEHDVEWSRNSAKCQCIANALAGIRAGSEGHAVIVKSANLTLLCISGLFECKVSIKAGNINLPINDATLQRLRVTVKQSYRVLWQTY